VGLYLVAKGGGYAGSCAESKRSGQGIMRLPDGAIYQGQFAGDKFEGQGQYEYVDGSTYVGAWKAGKKHGQVGSCGHLLVYCCWRQGLASTARQHQSVFAVVIHSVIDSLISAARSGLSCCKLMQTT